VLQGSKRAGFWWDALSVRIFRGRKRKKISPRRAARSTIYHAASS